jgi:hypothetical protein
MWEIGGYLAAHAALHPSLRPRDTVKLCYQAAFGAEHLLEDAPAAREFFMEEFARVEAREAPLCEDASPALCRADISAWKAKGLPPEWLFRAFVLTASPPAEGAERVFLHYLDEAQALADAGALPFSGEEFHAFTADYLTGGIGPVHHSAEYRAAERPAYRLVKKSAARLFPLLARVAGLADAVKIVAIDGCCASGKTSMAADLAAILGAGVAHMDDFFLPPELRTPERLAAPGGNAHFERFREEVLPFLTLPEAFSYRVFDCSKMALDGTRAVAAGPYRIVEGAYCCHPALGNYASLRAFSDVDPATQRECIRERDGEAALAQYEARWIPMEEAYIAAFGIREKADVIL